MYRVIGILTLLAVVLASCGASATPATQPEQATTSTYTIVTSTSILADITTQIVGNTGTVVSLVGADSDAHVYEPSPADGVTVAKASALVAFGLEFEPWFEELYATSGSTAPYIVASADVTAIPTQNIGDAHADEHKGESADTYADEHKGESADTHADEHKGESADTHADEHKGESADAHADEHTEHAHGEYDPHVWQDVQNVIKMVEHINAELATVMPEHATTLTANADAYIAILTALDSEIAAQMASIPEAQRVLVTNHDTMSYFAQRYGLRIVGTVLGSVSTESGDPGANDIVTLVATIKESGAQAIFIEAFGNDDLVQTIATEAGVRIAPPLYTDALGSPGSKGATYVDMMRYNSQTIYEELGDASGQ